MLNVKNKGFLCTCLIITLFTCFGFSLFANSVVINELMSSNATTIADDDGDYEDWIELYNAGSEAINLSGYGLSDDYARPFRWVLPDVQLHPGGFLLVWASGKDRNNPEHALHTNFSINTLGEEVILTHPEGNRVDEVMPMHVPTDISYGRKPNGTGSWYFFEEPTPGQSNTGTAYNEVLSPPVFSLPGGFYQQTFELSLSHERNNATIIYTTDGSIPCINNTTGSQYVYKNRYQQNPVNLPGKFFTNTFQSFIYQQPLSVTNRSDAEDKLTQISSTWHYNPPYFPSSPVKKGTVVRARAFGEGAIPSPIQTHTFFVYDDPASSYNLPVVSLVIQEDAFFDYYDGIYVAGVDFDEWRNRNRFAPASGFSPSNYTRRGEASEHPAHLEFFEKGSEKAALGEQIGVRIHGGWTRSFPNKSLRLYARNKYGNTHLEHPFFGSSNSTAFKRLLLRNSGNDAPLTMFRDAAIQSIVNHMWFDTQDYLPVALFVNGEYWGIHNLRERYDKHYLERVYGVDGENLDILTQYVPEVKEGDATHYQAMINYIEHNNLEDDAHYENVTTMMDVQNFADYNIAQIFAANTDWPGNNVDFWRLRTNGYVDNTKYGHDGRWRWLMYDTDFGFGFRESPAPYMHNTLVYATHPSSNQPRNKPETTFLLRNLLKNEQFRHHFINRFADQLNSAFRPERTKSIIQELKQQIEPEIQQHIHRWKSPANYQQWLENVDVMLDFAEHRPKHQFRHIYKYFDLNGIYELTVQTSNQLMGHVRVNSITINKETPGIPQYSNPWRGSYFKGVPIELEAIPKPGYTFTHWEGAVNATSPVIQITPTADIEVIACFQKTNEPVLIYKWFFDTTIPNNTPLERLQAYYSIMDGGALEYLSCLEGYPFNKDHPQWRKASMERRNQPTAINYRPDANNDIAYTNANMRGLQVRQPFTDNNRQNTMIFHAPTSGFSDIILRFAAKDEGAADHLIIDYAVNAAADSWTSAGLANHILPLESGYQLYEVDFSEIAAVSNNHNFRFRIRFDGSNMWQDAGNRVTFNNFTIDGKVKNAFNIYASANNYGIISPSGIIPVYELDDIDFYMLPVQNFLISDVIVDDISVLEQLTFSGDTAVYKFQGVYHDHHIHVSFRFDQQLINDDQIVRVFPNPVRDIMNIVSLEEFHKLEIRNIFGQPVLTREYSSTYKISINLQHLQNGMYYVSIYTGSHAVTKKILIVS